MVIDGNWTCHEDRFIMYKNTKKKTKLNHTHVYLKLLGYCMSIILQLKKGERSQEVLIKAKVRDNHKMNKSLVSE